MTSEVIDCLHSNQAIISETKAYNYLLLIITLIVYIIIISQYISKIGFIEIILIPSYWLCLQEVLEIMKRSGIILRNNEIKFLRGRFEHATCICVHVVPRKQFFTFYGNIWSECFRISRNPWKNPSSLLVEVSRSRTHDPRV